ncbi:hypothetical protein Y5S_01974 [Alcanivorax nanhaiticus]|uniref:Uncharacterized protein n=2 Tax=Alcanivorax nanhaiticus TaxID=1177154 RepID=A0A095TQI1_9GAMM|nr:hypothetical protein Y5S_01974 [Alcanivorax nanhaiticus]
MSSRRYFYAVNGSLALLAISLSAPVTASEVTGLTTFVPNTPALAEEVNGNFDSVKTAVDDNDQRITDLEAKLLDGAVSLSAFAFSEWRANTNPSSACQMSRLGTYAYFDLFWAKSVGCQMSAPLHLPQGATVSGLSCLVNDNIYGTTEDTFFSNVSLRRLDLSTANLDVIYRISQNSINVGLQTITGAPNTPEPNDLIIDNSQFAYTLMVSSDYASDVDAGDVLKLHGCKVEYSLP